MILRSELAKAAGWALAALSISGEVVPALLDGLRARDPARVSAAYRWICNERAPALDAVTALSGLSRQETCRAVWAKLLSAYRGCLGPDDLDSLRTSIKDPLILGHAVPILGTIEFIRALRGRLCLGLVTQASHRDVEEQARHFSLPLDAFQVIECCVDRSHLSARFNDPKAAAYSHACERLRISSSEAIAFEDSTAGLRAATAIGLACIALREPHNRQDLSLAKLVVGDLRHFGRPDVVQIFVDRSPGETIDALAAIDNARPA